MWLMFPIFFHILDKFFTLRSATLVETGIDGVLIRIHQFTHLHAEQERLTVTFGDTETAQQLRSNLAALIVGFQNLAGSVVLDSIIDRKLLEPVVFVLTTVAVPGIASPHLIPHPVAVNLQLTAAIGQFIGSIGPIPITSLRIKVEPLAVMHAVHSLNGLLCKGR